LGDEVVVAKLLNGTRRLVKPLGRCSRVLLDGSFRNLLDDRFPADHSAAEVDEGHALIA
jgi:hypothetical protein